MHILGEDLLKALYKFFYLPFCVSSDQWKNTVQQRFSKEFEKDSYMKIIVTIISTDSVTSLFSSLVCPFIKTESNNQIFSKLVIW